MDLHEVCHFLAASQSRGGATVLVMVCAVEGSSMRNPGTIMAVAEDGSFAGSLSGGCIENAVVAEALDVLETGDARMVRFGAGSRYLDIKLPCGGGLDLHFSPLAEDGFVSYCLASLESRQPFSIAVSPSGAVHLPRMVRSTFDRETGSGVFGQWPVPLLQIVGHGAGVEALTRLGLTMGCMARVLTPDDRIIEGLSGMGIETVRLARTDQTGGLTGDPWTASIFLFHDHDWEVDLLVRALDLPHFYIGAMGGRHAHAVRCDALKERGVSNEVLATIKAPIGLFHSSRDPQTLALSTLAQVIRIYEEATFEARRAR